MSDAEDERKTILAMLLNATRERERFIYNGEILKNKSGTDLFIDAGRIDAVIDAIRARGAVGTGKHP